LKATQPQARKWPEIERNGKDGFKTEKQETTRMGGVKKASSPRFKRFPRKERKKRGQEENQARGGRKCRRKLKKQNHKRIEHFSSQRGGFNLGLDQGGENWKPKCAWGGGHLLASKGEWVMRSIRGLE